jgi:aminopeptidase YwaD
VNKRYFILFLLFTTVFVQGQKLKKADKQLIANLQQHIQYLASDQLEGRRTGTQGEKLAAQYISNEFKKIGLVPRGNADYFQAFEVNEGKLIAPSTFLKIDGKDLTPHKDFFPLAASPNADLAAQPSMALQEPGMPWFYDLKDLFEDNAGNPHFDLNEAIAKSAREAQKKGATAVFLYNTGKEDDLQFNGKDRSESLPVPVVYITREGLKKYLGDEAATLDLRLKIELGEKKRTGTNVIGYIDNGASTTVVLGAHYDHLGYGEDGNSRELAQKHQIYNGADDNASGTAALIELSRLLKQSKIRNNNYLMIAFSAEELGLYGSKYFTEHPTVGLEKINYMINMDMVGRLSDSSHVVTVGGYGTSPSWGAVYNQKGKKGIYEGGLVFRFDSSGMGPSDHTSFYLKNIPVLFYFTGLHADYHKPTDDFDKINYIGEMNLVKHILSVISTEDKQKSRLVFTKTREMQTTTNARFSVTMGIMPDYTFNGVGVRVDAVSDNRPAQRAGLKAGDVILSLGDYKTSSLETYMQALGKFKKGDKTTVIYNRGTQILSSSVEF